MPGIEALEEIRAQIERKHSEAIKALETLRAYFADAEQQLELPGFRKPAADTTAAKVFPPPITLSSATAVDKVLNAIADEYKTVPQLQEQLGMSRESVRAVLYSKFVQSRISKKQAGKLMSFKRKASAAPAVNGQASNVAGLVRDLLSGHPDGLTHSQIHATLAETVKKMGASDKSIGAALSYFKKTGKVLHNELTGAYVPVKGQ